MPRTEIRNEQILDSEIQRADLDITTAGQALIRRVVAGTNLTISSTGVDTGTGDVTLNVTSDSLKANLASPTFTGTPTVPTGTIATTQTAGNSTTAIATTDFATTALTTERTATRTVSGMRVNPRTNSTTTAATLAPDLSVANVYYRTTQTETLTISAPIGTPVIGETLYIEVSSVAAQTLTINATYIVFGAAFPAATTAGKSFLMTCTFNGTNWRTLWSNQV